MEFNPTVEEIIALMEDARGEWATQLFSLVSAWPEVEKDTVYDGFCREWTPACYCRGAQLFHLHNFRQGLRGTVFVGVRTLEPVLLNSEQVPIGMQRQVAETAGSSTKQVRVPIESDQDVADFAQLVRAKWEAIQSGLVRSATRRRQKRPSG